VRVRRSWLALLTFCTTSTLVIALGLAVLFAGVAAAFAVADASRPDAEAANAATQAPTSADSKVFVGLITDDRCGARHPMDSGKSPTECTRMCVRSGARYALVDGDKKYVLDGSGTGLDKVAGQRASVAGTLVGDTIRVNSITTQ